MNSPVIFAGPATVSVMVRANVRQGAPSVAAPIRDRVDARTDLAVTGWCVGDRLGANDRWWTLADNGFIWSGTCSNVVRTPAAVAPARPPAVAPVQGAQTSLAIVDMREPATMYLPLLKENGVKAIGRYYSTSLAKVLTSREAQAISGAGLDIFVVHEDGNDPTSFDGDSGTSHAQTALRCARNVGQPASSAIYFAADFDVSQEQLQNQMIPYFKSIHAVMREAGSLYRIGVYSNGLVCEALLDAGLAEITWLSSSTHYRGTEAFYASRRWKLAQGLPRLLSETNDRVSVDPNEVNGDFGGFRVPPVPATSPSRLVAPGEAQATANGGLAPWMVWMRQHQGEVQQTGAKPTPFTVEIFSNTDFGPLNGYTPESCAATVCAALAETGFSSTRSAAAISYRDYGTQCDIQAGCIVVFQWDNGQHHVDFCDSIVDDDTIRGLGGNQGSQLKDSDYSRRFIIATRWPVK